MSLGLDLIYETEGLLVLVLSRLRDSKGVQSCSRSRLIIFVSQISAVLNFPYSAINKHYIDGDGQNVNRKTFPSIYAPFHRIIICHRCKEGKKTKNVKILQCWDKNETGTTGFYDYLL